MSVPSRQASRAVSKTISPCLGLYVAGHPEKALASVSNLSYVCAEGTRRRNAKEC